MKDFVDSYVCWWVSPGLVTNGHCAKNSKTSRSPWSTNEFLMFIPDGTDCHKGEMNKTSV